MVKLNKHILLLVINLTLTILVGQFIISRREPSQSNSASRTVTMANEVFALADGKSQSDVQIVDLHKNLSTNFTCMKTKTLLGYFYTHICLHASEKDIYVSSSFKHGTSIWEEAEVARTMQMLVRYPHLDFIDIGANIGTYTMFAAAIGRSVIAVECFGPNVDRLHRAIQLANVTNRVVLVQNAIYKESGKFLRLFGNQSNIGGQELDVAGRPGTNQTVFYNETSSSDPYVVKTIRFDDLVPILTARNIRSAILKVDIEGSEKFVIETGKRVFDLIDIPMVQMEWMKVRQSPDAMNTVMDFFVQRNYEPRSIQCQVLYFNQTNTWPDDFYWVKTNVAFCS